MALLTHPSTIATAVTITFVTSGALASIADNFNDNVQGPQWTTVVDAVAQLNIIEQNQRLEVIANGSTNPNNDALYLSNGPSGFLLSTASDFEIKVDYTFTNPTAIGATSAGVGSALGMVFGIGRDLPNGTDSAAIGLGLVHHPTLGVQLAATVGYRVDDVETLVPIFPPFFTSGTLTITYNSALDNLTLEHASGSLLLTTLVQTLWQADEVYVSMGGRGQGFTVASGQMYLDNFQVVTGTVLPVPEPTSLALLTLGSLAVLRRRSVSS